MSKRADEKYKREKPQKCVKKKFSKAMKLKNNSNFFSKKKCFLTSYHTNAK